MEDNLKPAVKNRHNAMYTESVNTHLIDACCVQLPIYASME